MATAVMHQSESVQDPPFRQKVLSNPWVEGLWDANLDYGFVIICLLKR